MNSLWGLSPTGVPNPVDDWNCFPFIHSSKHSIEEGDFQSPLGAQATPQNMAKFLWENAHFVMIECFTSAPADVASTPFRNRFGIIWSRFEATNSAFRRPFVNPTVKNHRIAVRTPPSSCCTPIIIRDKAAECGNLQSIELAIIQSNATMEL